MSSPTNLSSVASCDMSCTGFRKLQQVAQYNGESVEHFWLDLAPASQRAMPPGRRRDPPHEIAPLRLAKPRL
ncbi:hypothetical protein B0H14DRAFT_3482656 [Mycena olivaceomarginata]|nr:hypothetical protein B0H14DRAFT_3482656 [Mycena olivaceomarginata]